MEASQSDAPEGAVPAKTLSTPSITAAQVVGIIPLIAEFAHSFGIFNLTQPQQDSLSKLVTAGIALFGADAVIRLGRSLSKRF